MVVTKPKARPEGWRQQNKTGYSLGPGSEQYLLMIIIHK